MFNHEDIECPSCGGHWLQNCSCSWEEINKATEERQRIRANSKHMKTISLEDLIKERTKDE